MIWDRIVQFLRLLEWLPLMATPFAIYFLTDGFSHSLAPELWLFLGFAVIANLAWIALQRHVRGSAAFLKKYPGFRMNKHG